CGIAEGVAALEIHAVSAIPEQTLLPVLERETSLDPAGFESERHRSVGFLGLGGFVAVSFGFDGELVDPVVVCRGRRLLLRSAPDRGHTRAQLSIVLKGAVV